MTPKKHKEVDLAVRDAERERILKEEEAAAAAAAARGEEDNDEEFIEDLYWVDLRYRDDITNEIVNTRYTGDFTIGSGNSATIQLRDPKLDLLHGTVYFEEKTERWYYEDEGHATPMRVLVI